MSSTRSNRKIQLVMLTGFLGSGKTTLLRHLLDSSKALRIGIIINEFGKVGIDGAVVRRDGVEVVELNGGQIFCTCLATDVLRTLTAFSKMPIEYLLLETAGLANPSSLDTLLNDVKQITQNAFDYKGMVCVADAVQFTDLIEVAAPVRHQVKKSDMIVINKIDLVGPSEIKKTEETIRSLNPNANVLKTAFCRISAEDVFNLSPHRDVKEFLGFDLSGADIGSFPRPVTFVLKTTEPVNFEAVEQFCKAIANGTYRIKGFVLGPIHCMHIDAVQDQLEFNLTDHRRSNTEIVIISKIGISLAEMIETQWNRFVKIPYSIES